ncbi:isoleucine--tRNA ligase [Persicimonas caeni]|uniref:Isoleucine--tRNA ligase n=1 Tax=Persicimonas caeni TaxID=2292766 RepID=A0A4Y6PUL6_PERCE|nr:isoleucine--tRNA ligase [Persicimonas caeni]QDG51998.1 isoleucine--tRNA ligase [Persicimonas caeni]QED33219.1 isoleucine--tRNA ligase [Persicimonas caeni]
MGKDYKATLNLPSTDFPMRANLSDREQDQIMRWERDDIYGKMIARRKDEGAQRYILHDGPPYANGNIHHGHILNKTLKDFVIKYRNLAGYLAEYVPGWDCHGLPIEHKVDQNLGEKKRDMSKVEVRQACREYADKWVNIQAEEFQRMMIFGAWERPYTTMSYDYEATIVRELGKFFDKGIVYRGLKPVHWDWAAKTALAEAEVEYDEFRTEHVYVKFPFSQLPDELAEKAGDKDVYVLIWTTTPWTLPANLAIALNPDLNYQLVGHGDEVYVMAEGRRATVLEECDIAEDDVETLANFEGRELVGELGEGKGLAADHAWLERESVLLPADYVTLDQGTGCVHTAPGHGQEDFQLGQHFGLDVICPVDQEAKFYIDLPVQADDGEKNMKGVHVLTANKYIAQHLANMGRLLNKAGDRITIPRYPYGWRTKKPVIFRATTQWFIAMEPETAGNPDGLRLREEALDEIQKVNWVPGWGQDRIEGMVEGRPDWCISRQRSWGAPITVMYCNDCDEALATGELCNHVADLIEEEGADVWFDRSPADLLPEGMSCAECGGTEFTKEQDILDVWFDSGVSWSAVLENELGWGDLADLYLEGSDQHRGWFQSSLLACVGTRGHSPYKTCLTHGFVTDEDGHKYSKSSKNFEPPEKMLQEYGAEILRLWVAAVDYKGDITLSDEILKRIADGYRKIRNTFRFMLGNLGSFDASQAVDYDRLHDIDKWVLHRTAEVVERIQEAYENYQFHTIYHTLLQFMTVDLSNIYMDVTKDRMYCELPDGEARLAGQTAYWSVLHALVRATAPILSFTSEEVWQHLDHGEDDPESVFLADFPDVPAEWKNDELAAKWETLLEVRQDVQRALEEKRVPRKQKKPGQIGSSQEAHVTVTAEGDTLELLRDYAEMLDALFIVSYADVVEGEVPEDQSVGVEVVPAEGEKCPRCWNYWIEPGSDKDVCDRCESVVEQLD